MSKSKTKLVRISSELEQTLRDFARRTNRTIIGASEEINKKLKKKKNETLEF